VAALKGGPHCGYSSDGGLIINKFKNQPKCGNTSGFGPGGSLAIGQPGQVVHFPTFSEFPSYTSDNGETAWKYINFFLENGTQLDLASRPRGYHGFHGAPYYSNHQPVGVDKDGTFWVVNIGSETTSNTSSWESDEGGWGGVYRCRQQDFPNFTRVKAGRPITWGNLSLYGTRTLPTPDGTKIICMGNSLGGDAVGNNWVIMDAAAPYTYRIVSNIYNLEWCDFGCPIKTGTPPPLYMLGWVNSVYGLWISFDLCQTTPIGPFNTDIKRGGAISAFSASKTVPGKIVAAIDGMGHCVGNLKGV
jgi:hypothetical protein